MAKDNELAPIIIKRKKVIAGGGHHGGAWKVAYADFVTAMMAFFMLMWLLNATTEKQRKGIADYFAPTIAINRISGGGNGDFGGDSVFSENVLAQNGTGASNRNPTEANQARGALGQGDDGGKASAEDDLFSAVERNMLGKGGESMASDEPLKHIVTKVTDQGLVVELFDLEDRPLFSELDEPTPTLVALARLLADTSDLLENNVAVEGYVSAVPVVRATNPVWSMSTRRADIFRQLVAGAGLSEDRIKRVTGHADRKPVVRNPMSVRNNRIEFIFLRSDT